MYAMKLFLQIFLPMTLFEQGFALDNLDEFQRYKRSSRDGYYIGCYALGHGGCLNFQHNVSFPESMGTTPDSCKARCRDKGFTFAYVYQRSKCSCSCDEGCLEGRLDDWKCGLPCHIQDHEDQQIFCGGLYSSSVYEVEFPDVFCPNILNATKQTSDGPADKHYTTLVSFLVIFCSIICVLIIMLVIFHRRMRKWTSSQIVRANSRRSRRRGNHGTYRPNAKEGDNHQVVSNMSSSLQAIPGTSEPHGNMAGTDQCSPRGDDQIYPYEVSNVPDEDQETWYSRNYATLERNDTFTVSFQEDCYLKPSVGLNMKQTSVRKNGKEGYLVPGIFKRGHNQGRPCVLHR